MLVLMRKKDESILIGDNIAVTITKINCDKVMLAIRALKSINLMRGERAAKLEGSNDMDITINTTRSGKGWLERRVERKVDESLLIGKDIKLMITKIDHRQVSIGIEAPEHIDIFRKEYRKQAEPSNYF